MMRLLVLPLLCTLMSCQKDGLMHAPRANSLVFSTSWERGIDPKIRREARSGEDLRIVPLDQAGIPNALEATIRRDANYKEVASGTPRAELSFDEIMRFVRGGDYIITWQTYLPRDYAVDKKQSEVISQIHQGPGSGYPTFALFIAETGEYGVRMRTGKGRPSPGGRFGEVEQDKGRLISWTLHYIPDDTGQYALTRLEKDGVQVFKASGVPNAYPLDDGAYFKIGLYKSNWQKQPSDADLRRIYYGKLSIVRMHEIR